MSHLSQKELDRAAELVSQFVAWTPDIGPCPIGINDHPWFKRLCANMEIRAHLEAELDALRAENAQLRQERDNRVREMEI